MRPRRCAFHDGDPAADIRSTRQPHAEIAIIRLRKVKRQRPAIRHRLRLRLRRENSVWRPALDAVIRHGYMNDVVGSALWHVAFGTVFTMCGNVAMTISARLVEASVLVAG